MILSEIESYLQNVETICTDIIEEANKAELPPRKGKGQGHTSQQGSQRVRQHATSQSKKF